MIEFRVKTDANQKWEDLPVICTVACGYMIADVCSFVILQIVPSAIEVRWNIANSSQGHYVS